ncbi:MAG TPA: FAD-dependent oxidoreductase, partial [Vicinamibacterales bacterium]|nr:FAD-dependent oxidoreductase [Vicinamibacterales bacterium]
MARPSDIIVVGAGIVGCAVAAELARRGASVEIIDERLIGMGATQASAGVLAPYIEAREGSPLLDLTIRSLALYDDFVARTIAESGLAVMYRRTGTIDIATSDTEVQALRARGPAHTPWRAGAAARRADGSQRGTASRRRRGRRAADRDARLRRRGRPHARAGGGRATLRRAAHRAE